MNNFAAVVVFLCVLTRIQNGQGMKNDNREPSVQMFVKTCYNCIGPESTLLCHTISNKCLYFHHKSNGQRKSAKLINIMRLTNILSQKLMHARPGSAADQCGTFRKMISGSNRICDLISDLRVYSYTHRVADSHLETSEANHMLPFEGNRLFDYLIESGMSDRNHFKKKIKRVQGSSFNRNNIYRRLTTTNVDPTFSITQYGCDHFYQTWCIYIPDLPKWKAIKRAINSAVKKAAQTYGKGVYRYDGAEIKVIRSDIYLVPLRGECFL